MVLVNIQSDFEDVIHDVSTAKVEQDQFWINLIDEDQLEDGQVHEEVVVVSKFNQDIQFANKHGLIFTKDSKNSYQINFEGNQIRLTSPVSTIDTKVDKVTSFDIFPQEDLGLLGLDNGHLRVVKLSDTEDGLIIENGHFSTITHSKFFPSGKVGLSIGLDLQIKIWDLLHGSCPRTFVGHKERITDLSLIDRGRNFVTSSKDGTVKLWDCATGKEVASLHRENSIKDPINAILILSSDGVNTPGNNETSIETTTGKLLLAGHESGVISHFDLGIKKQIGIFQSLFSEVKSLAQKSQNEIIAGYEDGTIAIWNIKNNGAGSVVKIQSIPKIKSVIFNEALQAILVSSEYGLLELILLPTDNVHDQVKGRTFVTGPELGTEVHITSGKKEFYVSTRDGLLRLIK